MSTIDVYVDEYWELDEFVKLCRDGLELGATATSNVDISERIAKVLRRPGPFRDDAHRTRAMEEAQKLERFAKSQKANGFPYLYTMAIIKLWSILESAVDDVVADQLRDHPLERFPALARIKGPLIEFMRASEVERTELLVEKIKSATDASLKRGSGRFETLLDAVALGGAIPEILRKVFVELSEVRNVLVHRNAIADKRFHEACSWFRATVGSPLYLTHNHYVMYGLTVIWYLIELDRRVSDAGGKVVPSEQASLQNDFCERIEEFFRSREALLNSALPEPNAT